MKYYLYVSVASEEKILTFKMDPATGKLSFHDEVKVGGSAGPLEVHPNQSFLYAGIRSTRHILSFRIDQSKGRLSLLGQVPLDSDPCYISTDRKANFLLSAYYGAGKVAVHPIKEDGTVGSQAVQQIPTADGAHCILTDPTNRFVFVPHIAGPNLIFQFNFDEKRGALTPNSTPKFIPEPGVGPRHICFHPDKDIVYSSNEQGCSVTAYNFNRSTGTLSAFQTISTLPQGYDGKNSCAQIHITPKGDFLYVSNRGHDSIAGFSIDESTGRLTAIGQQPTEAIPRAFNIDPTGNFLFAGGQASGRLASYRIDTQSGALLPLETYDVGKQSMWVLGLGHIFTGNYANYGNDLSIPA